MAKRCLLMLYMLQAKKKQERKFYHFTAGITGSRNLIVLLSWHNNIKLSCVTGWTDRRRNKMNKKYHVFKILDNGEKMFAHAVYAASKAEAQQKVISFYQWNHWITADNCIVKLAR